VKLLEGGVIASRKGASQAGLPALGRSREAQMKSKVWIVAAVAAAAALVAISIRKKRERDEAERIAVWG
jgi:hypothetical protein